MTLWYTFFVDRRFDLFKFLDYEYDLVDLLSVLIVSAFKKQCETFLIMYFKDYCFWRKFSEQYLGNIHFR